MDEGTEGVVVAWNIYGAAKNFDATFGDAEVYAPPLSTPHKPANQSQVPPLACSPQCIVDVLDPGYAKSLIHDDGPDPYQAVQIHDYLQVSFIHPLLQSGPSQREQSSSSNTQSCLIRSTLSTCLSSWVILYGYETLIARETLPRPQMLSYGVYPAKELRSKRALATYGGKGAQLPDWGCQSTQTGNWEVGSGGRVEKLEITPSDNPPRGRDARGGRLEDSGGVGDSVRMVDSAGSGGGGEAAQPTSVVSEAQKDPPPVSVKEQ